MSDAPRGDGSYARRLDAVTAGYRGDAGTAVRLLRDEDPSVRTAALGALARCDKLRGQHVQSAMRDESAEVRRRAVELAPDDLELLSALSDPDASVVEAAAAALGERDWDPTPVAELCRVGGTHDDPLCRESAVAALGAIAAGLAQDYGADENGMGGAHSASARSMALKALLAAMTDRPQIRRRALLGLHQFTDGRAAEAVRAALEDRDRQVRAVASELLGRPEW